MGADENERPDSGSPGEISDSKDETSTETKLALFALSVCVAVLTSMDYAGRLSSRKQQCRDSGLFCLLQEVKRLLNEAFNIVDA
ncbi:unnamed protein product [Gongylonema pulchrum]|uniref:CASP-like protein n=1 Tax=Gongylonema pulchrum TaxID=637853 RepID=A0A183E9X1_9BILA|nr:unnamed protein product [Gongylonema pulchrum]